MSSKKVFINTLAKKIDFLAEEDIEIAVDKLLESIKNKLVAGNRIEIRGFGSFSLRPRKYAGKDKEYNTIYFRMSKNVATKLNPYLKDRD